MVSVSLLLLFFPEPDSKSRFKGAGENIGESNPFYSDSTCVHVKGIGKEISVV